MQAVAPACSPVHQRRKRSDSGNMCCLADETTQCGRLEAAVERSRVVMRKFRFGKSLKQQSSRRPAAGGRSSAPAVAAWPSVEPLERREMFSVTTGVVNNELVITSGNGDSVTLDHAGAS